MGRALPQCRENHWIRKGPVIRQGKEGGEAIRKRKDTFWKLVDDGTAPRTGKTKSLPIVGYPGGETFSFVLGGKEE